MYFETLFFINLNYLYLKRQTIMNTTTAKRLPKAALLPSSSKNTKKGFSFYKTNLYWLHFSKSGVAIRGSPILFLLKRKRNWLLNKRYFSAFSKIRFPPKHRRTPPRCRSVPVNQRNAPANHRRSPAKHRSVPVKRRSVPAKRRSVPANQRKSPAIQRRSPARYRKRY